MWTWWRLQVTQCFSAVVVSILEEEKVVFAANAAGSKLDPSSLVKIGNFQMIFGTGGPRQVRRVPDARYTMEARRRP